MLAPLHNPANLAGIVAAERAFPDVPHVAVFDTAFHQTLPPAAYTYAIDRELAAKHRVRRYGFHGTSHRFVSRAAAEFLERPVEELRMIVLHLGNGASACAVVGRPLGGDEHGHDPARGPRDGHPLGRHRPRGAPAPAAGRPASTRTPPTRCSTRAAASSGSAATPTCATSSTASEAGDEAATLALEVYAHRIRSYVGAYAAQLGRVDAIVFTAGVGENAPIVREWSLAGLEGFGVEVDPERNRERGSGAASHLDGCLEGRRARRAHERGARDRAADARGRRRLSARAGSSPRDLVSQREDARRPHATARRCVRKTVLRKKSCARVWRCERHAARHPSSPTTRRRQRATRRRPRIDLHDAGPDAGARAPAAPAHPRPAARRGPAVGRRARRGARARHPAR